MTTRSGEGILTDYSVTTVDTTTWKVLVASTPLTVTSMAIFDSSGLMMEIGMCLASEDADSEVRQFLIPPGGVNVKIQIPSGYRISLRAVTSDATGGLNAANILY